MGEREKPDYFTGWNVMLLAALALIGAFGVFLSVLSLFLLPLLISDTSSYEEVTGFGHSNGFAAAPVWANATKGFSTASSPHTYPLEIICPQLKEDSAINVWEFSQRREMDVHECVGPDNILESIGNRTVRCDVELAYKYAPQDERVLFAVYTRGEAKPIVSKPITLAVDWTGYEGSFWGTAAVTALMAFAGAIVVILVAAAMVFTVRNTKHETLYPGEYSLKGLIWPFQKGMTGCQLYQAILGSPITWALELAGILLIILYMAVSFRVWSSPTAAYSFVISGIFAFILPLLTVAAVWFADYKEREPIRLIASMFLWGSFTGILAIGFNTMGETMLSLFGVGLLSAPFIAPMIEEVFKGSGLVAISLHHEFDDMVDGIVYGFTIGAGFCFIENWLYLMKSPMGENALAWFLIFFMRSGMFLANHSVFTSFTGAVIGYLKQKNVRWAPYGLFIGVIPAVFLHFVHNFTATFGPMMGPIGILLALMVWAVFDWGGLAIVCILLIAGVYGMQRKKPLG
jgi:protease PrsW